MSVVFENDEAEEIAQEAGWSKAKGRRLLERFINEQGLDDQFVVFLEHRRDAERGDEDDDDDEIGESGGFVDDP